MIAKGRRTKDMHLFRRAGALAGSFAIVLGAAAAASAQTPEQFYRGKSVDLVIGYPTGGSNDFYSRLLARHLGEHIPGHPNVVPRNTPGAGSFLALNQVFNVAQKDGTVIGLAAPLGALNCIGIFDISMRE